MKHIGNELDKILTSQKIQKKKFAEEKLGMTQNNLSNILKKNSIDAELLERISKALNVPINFWFDDNLPQIAQSGTGNVIGHLNHVTISDCEIKLEAAYKEIEHLKQRLKDKEEMIEILKKQ